MASADIMQQIQDYGEQPDFKQNLAQLYDKPVLQPLTQERAKLDSQYLTSIFDPFTKMGTGAADMSPAAKLAAIGDSVGRLGGRIGANQNVQNFYGAQINDLAAQESQRWQQGKNDLMNMYNMQYQREQDEESRRRANAATAQSNYYQDLINSLTNGQSTNDPLSVTIPGVMDKVTDTMGSGIGALFNQPKGSGTYSQAKNSLNNAGQLQNAYNNIGFLR